MSPTTNYIRKLTLMLLWLLAVLIIVAPYFPSLNLVTNYTIHFMGLFLGIGFIGYFLNNRQVILTSFAIAALLCVQLKNETDTPFTLQKDRNEKQLHIAHINLANVSDPFELIPALLKLDCDLISIVELTPDWEQILLSSLSEDYRFHTEMVRIDPFGKAIFSKYPILKVDTITFEETSDLLVEVLIEDQSYNIFNTYIVPPLDKTSELKAKNQLSKLTTALQGVPHSIVLGEYNMVYWSTLLKDFKTNALLQSSRRDIIPSSLDVPRDHAFHSAEMKCLGIKDINLNDGSRAGILAKYKLNMAFPREIEPVKLSKLN